MQLNLTIEEGQIVLDSLDLAFKAGHPAGLNGVMLAASVVSKIQASAAQPEQLAQVVNAATGESEGTAS